MKLAPAFYRRGGVVDVSRDLLGKVLCTKIDGVLTEAVITETEAYAGETDRASHAYGGRRTKRTEPMFAGGGLAYVYLCYGIHHLFNVVTGDAGTPHAVLVRAGVPLTGFDDMLARRGRSSPSKPLMSGPGTFAQALGIRTCMTGTDLSGDRIWIEDRGIGLDAASIRSGPRVGVDYAGEDAALPYRFIATVDELPETIRIRRQESDRPHSSAVV
jgi:DNA-3-methyladenine glycosylase